MEGHELNMKRNFEATNKTYNEQDIMTPFKINPKTLALPAGYRTAWDSNKVQRNVKPASNPQAILIVKSRDVEGIGVEHLELRRLGKHLTQMNSKFYEDLTTAYTCNNEQDRLTPFKVPVGAGGKSKSVGIYLKWRHAVF